MTQAIKIWRNQAKNYQSLNREGKVISYTKVIEAPQEFRGPYWVVLVELKDKTKLVGQWTAVNSPEIGDRVVGVLRRLNLAASGEVIEYGVKWQKQ